LIIFKCHTSDDNWRFIDVIVSHVYIDIDMPICCMTLVNKDNNNNKIYRQQNLKKS